MDRLKKYDIDIINLVDGEHVFQYTSDEDFFDAFPQSLIQKGNFDARLVLHKSPTMIRLDFDVKGDVERESDRTLESYEEPVNTNNRVFLKFGDRDEELTDEIEMIQRGTMRINVAKYLYEFIALSLPVKSLHPDLRGEESEGDLLVYSGASEEEAEEESIDPRWEVLKRISKKTK